MKKHIVNLGIIGCGHWGPNYIRDFMSFDKCRVKLVCDLNRERLGRIKERLPSVETTSNYKQLVRHPEIDGVIIATPAVTHYELAGMSLRNGKHVLVEKPIATSVKHAESLIELSKKVNRILMPGHIFEYHDGIRKMKSYVNQRRLGKIYYMYSRRTNLGPIRDDVNAMWDLSTHDISIFNFLLDRLPESVSANGFSYLRKGIQDVGFVTLCYPKNIIVHIHVSWLDPRKIREIVIIGDKKMLMFDDLDNESPIKIYDKRVMKKRYERPYYTYEEFKMIVRDGGVVIPKIKIKEPLKAECEHFLDYISNGKIPEKYLRRGIDAVRILAGIDKSLKRRGREVKLRWKT